MNEAETILTYVKLTFVGMFLGSMLAVLVSWYEWSYPSDGFRISNYTGEWQQYITIKGNSTEDAINAYWRTINEHEADR